MWREQTEKVLCARIWTECSDSEQKRTGLFTSPHLVKINERIVIDGQMILDERFLEVFEETMQAVDKMKEAGLSHPTFFRVPFRYGGACICRKRRGICRS